jgi:hypothetical protein
MRMLTLNLMGCATKSGKIGVERSSRFPANSGKRERMIPDDWRPPNSIHWTWMIYGTKGTSLAKPGTPGWLQWTAATKSPVRSSRWYYRGIRGVEKDYGAERVCMSARFSCRGSQRLYRGRRGRSRPSIAGNGRDMAAVSTRFRARILQGKLPETRSR